MHLKTRTWAIISLLLFLLAGILWWLGDQLRQAQSPRANPTNAVPAAVPGPQGHSSPAPQLTRPQFRPNPATGTAMAMNQALAPNASTSDPASAASAGRRNPDRLTNTSQPLKDLMRSETAILLRNAFIDSTQPGPEIPSALKATADPGAYIVQARGLITESFRQALAGAGAAVVSYVPNNAYLVQVSEAGSRQLAAQSTVQAVLPYEPYYKLESPLLALALAQQDLPEDTRLNVSLFPGQAEAGKVLVDNLGGEVLAESSSPFGPLLTVQVPSHQWLALAQDPTVQGLEKVYPRKPANDLARTRVAVSADPVVADNYLGLTGSNVLVNVNDSGVDASRPDLAGRVMSIHPFFLQDPAGHGTHVAGIIAGDGSVSSSVTNAPGSITNANYRGLAPAAKIFVLPSDVNTGPQQSDVYLQQTAAKTNALISNNSWGYAGVRDYNLSAASYDAAVRDALPEVAGSQSMIFVFAAGNEGFGNADGGGGESDSIRSPGTAKNVITVGAMEQLRNITNEVVIPDNMGNNFTNAPWSGETDTDNEVAASSSRGNVGVGSEGEFGRYKPDVVAPGTFVVSTRSTGWKIEQQAVTNSIFYGNQMSVPETLNNYSIFVPANAAGLEIHVNPTVQYAPIWPGLPLYLRQWTFPTTTEYDVLRTNRLILPRDYPISEADWYYSVGNNSGDWIGYNLEARLILTNVSGNYYEVLSGLNDELGTDYRYDSGTSMAAPVVSGMLALMKEFFEQRVPANMRRTNSPALMKALLINGARSVNERYDFCPTQTLNPQGWGLVNLPNSLPAGLLEGSLASSPLQFIDQSPTNALASGESFTWNLTVDTNAQFDVLRVTLVWTDPPGNPNAAIKLVNDLDLIVTNLDAGLVYLGNDIEIGFDYNRTWGGGEPAPRDQVNNVENVFLPPLLSTNYSITVRARRVNVNALTSHTNQIAQDYALVVSLGNLGLTNAFTLKPATQTNAIVLRSLTQLTNGVPLLNQRVAANPPLINSPIGGTNQWNFYVFTNVMLPGAFSTLTNGSNVAFITFMPPELSLPRNVDADIDIYVSTNSALTNMDPTAIDQAWKATNRGGDEVVFRTNAAIGDIFYVGVKSEDQQAAEFSLMTISTDMPFDEDYEGSRILHGLPYNVPIPDGSPAKPGGGFVFAICTKAVTVGRVVVTNILSHQNLGDWVGSLQHGSDMVVLNNHSLNNGVYSFTNAVFIYDDSNQGDIPYARPSDGPGSLNNFANNNPVGVWRLTMVDNSLAQTGRVERVDIRLYPEQAMAGLAGTVNPNSWEYYYLDVTPDITNFTIFIWDIDPEMPLSLYVRRSEAPDTFNYDKSQLIDPRLGLTNWISYSIYDSPPLNPGRYYVGVFNPNAVSVSYRIRAELDYSATGSVIRSYVAQDTPLRILDDAITRSTNYVDMDRQIADIRVGLRVDHPRPSDLTFHLVSPQGTRVLLMENRGGQSSGSLGTGYSQMGINYLTFTENTNLADTFIKFVPPPFTNNLRIWTNRFVLMDGFENGAPTNYAFGSGFFSGGWFLESGEVKILRAGYKGLVVHSGIQCLDLNGNQPGSISTNIATIPGKRYALNYYYARNPDSLGASVPPAMAVYVNGLLVGSHTVNYTNTFSDPQWRTLSAPFEFTALGAWTKIEFASTTTGAAGVLLDTVQVAELESGYFYLSEETLDLFDGESSLGNWVLEITDSRVGGNSPAPQMVSWQLQMIFAIPGQQAITLTNGVPYIGTVEGIGTRYFVVNVPLAARVGTNELATVNGPGNLTLFYSRDGLPVGDRTVDPLVADLNGTGVIQMIITTNYPLVAPMRPGGRYYLAVQNQNPNETNVFRILVMFDHVDDTNLVQVTSLTNGLFYTNTVPPGTVFDYYQFNVTSNGAVVRFDLFPINGDVDLYVRKARPVSDPLPTFTRYDYLSDLAGTNTDIIFVNRGSPVALTPGLWYLGVYNFENFPVNYAVRATEFTNAIVQVVMLTNGIPYNSRVLPGNVINTVYGLSITDTNPFARFQLYNLNGDADLILRRDAFPSLTNYDAQSYAPGTNSEQITIATDPPADLLDSDLNGLWYLAVLNAGSTPVNFTLRGTVTPNFTDLANGVVLTNNLNAAGKWNYYRFVVDSNATMAMFSAVPANGDVILLASKDDGELEPWPTLANYEAMSDVTGTEPEEIDLHPHSIPVLSPGTWYLAVGSKTAGPITYTINAQQFYQVAPQIITLTNTVAYTNTIAVTNLMDYYQFTVSNRATLAVWEILEANGQIAMFLKKGFPLPGPATNAYATTNASGAPAYIAVATNSVPVPLSPGTWYLAVTNRESRPVTYTVRVTEYYFRTPTYTQFINGVWMRGSVGPGPIPTNYFFINIGATNPVARFYLDNLSGPADLVLQRNQLPNAYTYDAASTNGGRTAEMIVIRAGPGSADINLPNLQGAWYAAVIDRDTKPVAFRIRVMVIPPFVTLTNGIPADYTNAPGGGWTYFQFNVSSNATAAEFNLIPKDGNVDLYMSKIVANDEPLPTMTPYDYDSASAQPGINPEQIILFPSSTPALSPGLWWLGVYNPGSTPVNYQILATEYYDVFPPIIKLTNNVPVTNSVVANQATYYSFNVVSNLQATFEIYQLDGNANLYINRGLPLPGAAAYDYASTRFGTNEDRVILDVLSQPVALTPGIYYLAVTNPTLTPVNYTIRVVEITNYVANVITLTNGVPLAYESPAGGFVTNFFRFPVTDTNAELRFSLTGLTGRGDLVVRRTNFPSATVFDYRSNRPGTNDELIIVRSNLFNRVLNGDWYIAVINHESTPIQYVVRAVTVPPITPLQNGLTRFGTVGAGWHYYSFQVSTNATMAMFKAEPYNGDIALYLRQESGSAEFWPTLTAFDYRSDNPDLAPEQLVVFTNSTPRPLAPGPWYLGLYNPTTNAISYSVVATESAYTNGAIPVLTNGLVITNTISLTNGVDYYQFVVSPDAFKAVFQTLSADGNVDLYLRYGLPLPGPDSSDYSSTNAGTALELITVLTNSTPVPLAPGTWFIGVSNAQGSPVTYAFKATEFKPSASTNLIIDPVVIITNGMVTLKWTSIVGATYAIEGKTNLFQTNWMVFATNIISTNVQMVYTFPQPNSPMAFFRILQTSLPPTEELIINKQLIITNGMLRLTWSSEIGASYYVQANTNIASTNWFDFSPVIVATNTITSYEIALSRLTNVFFFRVVKGVPAGPDITPAFVIPGLTYTNGLFMLNWIATPNLNFQAQYTTNFPAVWFTLTNIITSSTTNYTFIDTTIDPLVDPHRFYRLLQLP